MTQYLILHKVRGEPSFDCAEEIEPDMWITNSGYRAYPFQRWKIDECVPTEVLPLPKGWPDHFEVRGEIVQPKIDLGSMLSKLIPPIRRRI